ncbi:MAG: aspartate/glutamate racemase family protein [Chloroflexota bacterium]|nr:aspartate/glutamate racemase family protein [Dehalococcoidia bacterium]MDW8253463.1 aspartate/glutamate racemase family protein [Chloroflexota bacterium]
MMRIWYQYPAPLMGIRGAVFELLETVFARVKRPDTTIDLRTPKRGGRASLWPYEYFKFYAAREIFETIQRAEAEGYDGVLIGQSAEPALTESKELLHIPVTGIFESAIHLANQLGERFALVTIPSPSGVRPGKHVLPLLRNVRKYGLEGRLVGWSEIGMSAAAFNAAIASGARAAVHEAFFEAARGLIERGAEVIVPAETLLSVALAVDGIVEEPASGAAVVDLVTAGIKNLEMLIELHEKTGLLRSRSLSYARPRDEEIAETRAAFGLPRIGEASWPSSMKRGDASPT